MSRCGCSSVDGCQCFISGGNGTSISGAGTEADPYVIDAQHGAFGKSQRISGNLTLNSLIWADLDNTLDITLPALPGDLIEVAISAAWGPEDGVVGFLDVIAVTSGTHFGMGGAGGNGIVAWRGNALINQSIGGSFFRELVAGDIFGGDVTLRVRYKTDAATNKTLGANADAPFAFFARNHGAVL